MMISAFFPFLRFHCVRLYRARPFEFVGSVGSFLVMLLALAALLFETGRAKSQQAQLESQRLSLPRSSVPKPEAAMPGPAVPDLPWFQSTQLLEQFSRVAADRQLSLDEVGYVLEEGANHPYLRYRITMTVAAGYPSIRAFADELTATMKHVDLDSISCIRSDIAIAAPTCELSFSAFFRKDAHA